MPRAEFTCLLNLDAYITFNKDLLPRAVGDWNSDIWDISSTEKRRKSKNGKRLYFRSWECSETNASTALGEVMPLPFRNFAKAYIAEYARERRISELSRICMILQCLAAATESIKGVACITKVDAQVANFAVDLIKTRFQFRSWSPNGRILECILDRIKQAGLTEWRMPWKQPFKYQTPPRSDRVKQANKASSPNKDKLPDVRAILALADIYHSATEDNDRLPTAFAALAMIAPERASEILTLPVDCETSMDREGIDSYGIRWRPLKGGQAKTNWVIGDGAKAVAKSAITYLKERGKKARVAARWYTENPDKLYLPPGFEHLRNIGSLTIWEASQILGRINPLKKACDKQKVFGLTEAVGLLTRAEMNGRCESKIGANQPHYVKLYSLAELEAYVLSRLPRSFPIMDAGSDLQYYDALWCLPANILRPDAETLEYLPDPISLHQINHQLGTNPGGLTVFSRHNKVDDNGNPWDITSHQFRHFLNTLAQSKHLSQELIAFWSGRKRVTQNAWYNHIPQEAYIEAYLKLENAVPSIGITGPLEEKSSSSQHSHAISRKDALQYELGATHKTRFGICRHDYSLTPCPKDKDCIGCGEHVFIKGNAEQIKEAKEQVELFTKGIAEAEAILIEGRRGAERWLKLNRPKLERWQLAYSKLTDPSIPDGTLISMPKPDVSQSKSGLADEIRKASTTNNETVSATNDDLDTLKKLGML